MSSPPASSPPAAPEGANPGLYTRLTMRWRYTPQVIWWRHPRVWGVPNPVLHTLLAAHAGQEHLEVGVGNGYFPSRLPAWSPVRTLHLMDVNPACLAIASHTLRRRFTLHSHHHSALTPWENLADDSVDSINSYMTLHAIERTGIGDLEPLVAEAHRVTKPGGCFFGATIVPKGAGVHLKPSAARLIEQYNAAGVFSNANDSVEDLHDLLEGHFAHVTTRAFGCVAVWEAVVR
ncbi:class I SAM-dependent methyltransferase [Salinactinospora qingdaonensis]|uniref:Methyltransferase type 11 domain-containing protein n=1 Tax=Salinactinospora qingdaonensis TaxID=702744 RepID=A0ABP7FUB7_9ACTN